MSGSDVPPVRIRYQTFEFGDTDIHVRVLRDRQQYDDVDGAAARLGIPEASWAHFGTVWESGERLARLMYTHDIQGLRILEVGCGIGLASLVLAARGADITATDQHPEVGAYMAINARLNGLPTIPFVRTDWSDRDTGLGLFDLIIGSDLLYEATEVAQLAGFIARHGRPGSQVIVIDPGRGLAGPFTRSMSEAGYRPQPEAPQTPGLRGRILRYAR